MKPPIREANPSDPHVTVFYDVDDKALDMEDVLDMLNNLLAQRAEELPPKRPPNAWSPISKNGLLRGIRHGQPTAEDLAIAEADGDTILYFYSFTVTTATGAAI